VPASPTQSRIVSPGPVLVHGSRFIFVGSQPAISGERAGKSRTLGNVRAPTEHQDRCAGYGDADGGLLDAGSATAGRSTGAARSDGRRRSRDGLY
jgi:hypothetical protein